jgi:hypothetical protein
MLITFIFNNKRLDLVRYGKYETVFNMSIASDYLPDKNCFRFLSVLVITL